MEFLSKLKWYPPSQLKFLILGVKGRICINICKRKKTVQIFFILLIQDLLSHRVKAFALNVRCMLFWKVTLDK